MPGVEGPEANRNVHPQQLLSVNLAAKGPGLVYVLWSGLLVAEGEVE